MSDNGVFRCVSLCRVLEDGAGRIVLKRLADVHEDELYEFKSDREKAFQASNRDRIYCRQDEYTEGELGIWEWTSAPNREKKGSDYITSNRNENLNPIVLIDVGVKDDEALRDALPDVINNQLYLADSDALIGYAKGNAYRCVFCKRSDIKIDSDSRARLADGTYTLPIYEVPSHEFIEFKNEDLVVFHSIERDSLGKHIGVLPVCDVNTAVKELLLSTMSLTYFKDCLDGTVAEWQRCRTFINKMASDNLADILKERLHCTFEEARGYLDDFIEKSNGLVGGKDFDLDYLCRLIENNDDLKASCYKAYLARNPMSANAGRVVDVASSVVASSNGSASTLAQAFAEATVETPKETDNTDKVKELQAKNKKLSEDLVAAQQINNELTEKLNNASGSQEHHDEELAELRSECESLRKQLVTAQEMAANAARAQLVAARNAGAAVESITNKSGSGAHSVDVMPGSLAAFAAQSAQGSGTASMGTPSMAAQVGTPTMPGCATTTVSVDLNNIPKLNKLADDLDSSTQEIIDQNDEILALLKNGSLANQVVQVLGSVLPSLMGNMGNAAFNAFGAPNQALGAMPQLNGVGMNNPALAAQLNGFANNGALANFNQAAFAQQAMVGQGVNPMAQQQFAALSGGAQQLAMGMNPNQAAFNNVAANQMPNMAQPMAANPMGMTPGAMPLGQANPAMAANLNAPIGEMADKPM